MEKNRQWVRLDNAAKIFPPTSSKRDTKVFRFVCDLKEPVDRTVLQHALDKTVEAFPLYRSILKKGFFWYYFEESSFKPTVSEDNLPVCAPLYDPYVHSLLFRVTYYKTRINIETFHALSDGAGAIQFLQTLVCRYIEEKYSLPVHELSDNSSLFQKNVDAFYKYYDKTKAVTTHKSSRAYRIRGERNYMERLGVIIGTVSAKAVIYNAHKYGSTVSEFLIANFICAICDHMAVRERKKPIVVSVPVNLRQFFPTSTTRNFFGVISVDYSIPAEGYTFSDVIESVKASFKAKLTKETANGIINKFSALENNPFVRAVPLFIKVPMLRIVNEFVNDRNTTSFSNLGRIVIPEDAAGYIKSFNVFLSARRPQICLCTFGDRLSIGITSPFTGTDIEQSFFRRLTDMGIDVEIISNHNQLNGEKE